MFRTLIVLVIVIASINSQPVYLQLFGGILKTGLTKAAPSLASTLAARALPAVAARMQAPIQRSVSNCHFRRRFIAIVTKNGRPLNQ